jgi:hypothetical protein
MEVEVTTGSAAGGPWHELARKIAALWQGPLPRRPQTRDPREIDRFYAQRYARQKSRHAAPSRSGENA